MIKLASGSKTVYTFTPKSILDAMGNFIVNIQKNKVYLVTQLNGKK